MAEDVRTRLGGPSSEVARREDLRDYLPAIEPERQVTDWGRSERVEGLVDRTVVDFLYHLWFRCEVEGIENVPDDGGALLVSNHSGALPPDAAMIVKAIKEEHPRPRPVHLTVEHFFKGYPGLLDAAAEDRRRRGAPGERAAPALRRAAARARLPRGPQGHREALQGPLPPAPLRPRRLRRGRDARRARRSCRSPSSAPRRRCRSSPSSSRCSA